MIKPRILCSIDRAMGFGDAVMAASTLKDLAEKYIVRVMAPDKTSQTLQLFNKEFGFDIFNVTQQGHFYKNDFIESFNLIYWDVYNRLRNLPHHAINCMREIAHLPLFTKNNKQILPELPIPENILEKTKLMLDSLPKPIIITNPLISYWSKMMIAGKYQIIVDLLCKLGGTVIQIGTRISPELTHSKALNLLNQTSLVETLAFLKCADLVFCGDTFVQHATATLKTPAVVFFCGTTPMDFGYPYFSSLFHPLEVPCQASKCGRPMR